jgi:hypothetical protein
MRWDDRRAAGGFAWSVLECENRGPIAVVMGPLPDGTLSVHEFGGDHFSTFRPVDSIKAEIEERLAEVPELDESDLAVPKTDPAPPPSK